MKHFTKYLTEDLGFIPFRYVNGKFVENKINDFSTMINGGLHLIYIKDDIKIWWGLNELGKPPTLVAPRPKINLKIDTSKYDGIFIRNSICEVFDDAMNVCLKKESPELIYKALFDNSIIFNYD